MSTGPTLTVMKDGEVIKSCPIEGEVVLGRAEDCTIWLNDRSISRVHAVFKKVGKEIQVEKKSEFGVLTVNGAECTKATLKETDVILIGPYLIRVTIPAAAPDIKIEVPIAENPLAESPPSADLGNAFDQAPMEGVGDELQDPNLDLNPELSSEPAHPGSDFDFGSGAPEMVAPPELSEPAEPPEPIDEDGKTKLTPSTKLAVKLVFPPGSANQTEFELTQDEISIGRGKDCDVVLNDKKSSRKNSIIRRAGLNFMIKDLNSANGTFVNGVRIEEQELSGDDLIKIGATEFQFKAISADYAQQEQNFMSLPAEIEEPDAPVDLGGGVGTDQNGFPMMDTSPQGTSEGQPVIGAVPGMTDAGIPGITGLPGATGKPKTLIEKFRALPRQRQIIVAISLAGLLYFGIFDEDEQPVVKKNTSASQKKGVVAATGPKGPATFESLSLEQKKFVETQHELAFEYYKNKEYDKALFEIRRIFPIVADYKDSKEIERYAEEGKRKTEAIEEERRKREEQVALKKRINQLVDETRALMDKKYYEQARELFTQILSIDPDNATVADWKKTIEAYEEQVRLQNQQKQVQVDINKHAWGIYREGTEFKKKGKYHSAIAQFQKVVDVGASDPKLLELSKKMMVQCRSIIRKLRDPVLQEAKEAETAGDFTKAFQLYRKAIRIDPPHREGYAGVNRIKGILHDRAKSIYTEAILAENFSDFDNAKKLFKECLQTAPPDDIYYERAQRKLAHYFKKDDGGPTQ